MNNDPSLNSQERVPATRQQAIELFNSIADSTIRHYESSLLQQEPSSVHSLDISYELLEEEGFSEHWDSARLSYVDSTGAGFARAQFITEKDVTTDREVMRLRRAVSFTRYDSDPEEAFILVVFDVIEPNTIQADLPTAHVERILEEQAAARAIMDKQSGVVVPEASAMKSLSTLEAKRLNRLLSYLIVTD